MESAGYAVKGEVYDCDLVGVRDGDAPVILVCEMKLAFNIELVMKGVKRASFYETMCMAGSNARAEAYTG